MLAAVILAMSSARVAAQVGATVSIFSDYRLRGYSISESRPVAVLDLSYDAPGGFYAGASGSVVHPDDELLRPLGLQVNGGYAKRLKSGLTLDVGGAHSTYASYSGLRYRRSYTELYAGVAGKVLSARVSVSPNYLGTGWTMYSEGSAQVSPARHLHLGATVGVLFPLDSRQGYGGQADGRIGLDWTSGRVSLHAAATARAGRNLYTIGHSSRTAILIGASYAM